MPSPFLQLDPCPLRILKAIFEVLLATDMLARLGNEEIHLAKRAFSLRKVVLGSLQLGSQILVHEGEAVIHHLVPKKVLVHLGRELSEEQAVSPE